MAETKAEPKPASRYERKEGYTYGWAPRRTVEAWLARGWELVPGNSPDNNTWRGDCVYVRIKTTEYKALLKGHREAYEILQGRINRGETPVDTSGVTLARVATERTSTDPRQSKR